MNIDDALPENEQLGDQEKEAELLDLKTQIISRCLEAKIEYKEEKSFLGGPGLLLFLPAGREKRNIPIFSAIGAKRLLSIPFEDYTFLSDYMAICSYQRGIIIAGINSLTATNEGRLLQRIFGHNPIRGRRDVAIEIGKKSEESSERITICAMPRDLEVLSANISALYKFPIALKLEGLEVSQHDQSVRILEKVANSLFFDIDLRYGMSLALWRERSPSTRQIGFAIRRTAIEAEFPKNEYDKEPLSLYWYARRARGMPLLQFLAYYQTIEFYFPIYSQVEARKRIRNILKTPGFNANRDADITRIITTINSNAGRGAGDERSQLRITLQECLDLNSLREFLNADEGRKKFFTSKDKTLSPHKLSLSNSEADIRNDVADRIYNIRCKIVHTKSGGNEDEGELLLPFSKEADLLEYDIELIRYVARRVLIAGSKEFRL